jgi:hypothetical protein
LAASYSEPIKMKVLHSVKKHDPITMPEVRLALLELLEDYAVRVRNRPTQFICPISDRQPIGFARRLNEISDVRRQPPLLDFAGMSGIQTIGYGGIVARHDQLSQMPFQFF